ncbi:hypothetical protein TSUD_327350 [Trifolium subterraneum]|uniref:DUF4283 domain-containing protein n=1 Tax=Trifolium subterraneum TaxID=3900 RepID=A0A2Z6PEI4_TRISU|nr:hypothetical protein TSUD_327350 [Trifolium subterraneum]
MLPQACVKGDNLAISIPEEEYDAGLNACKHNLHGRIIWPKGATPLTVSDLKNKLCTMWKDLSKWGVSSLGKGYYEFVFSTLEDVRRVRSIASWNLNPGMLKLFAWSKDFNPRVQQNVSAQVWVRFYGLSQEYWRPNIIFAIASSIGTPICIDSITAKPMIERTFGQFVRVLVEMDLSQTLRDRVLVERKGFAFFVEIDYENLPQFCTNCKLIGHHVGICKKLNFVVDDNTDKEVRDKRKFVKETKKVYAPKNDGRIEKKNDNEVINVESDKIETHEVNLSNSGEVNSKNIEVDSLLRASSSSKIDNAIPHQFQHNRFAVLEGNNDEGLISKQQTPSVPNPSSIFKDNGIAILIDPVALFKEQDQLLESELIVDHLKDNEAAVCTADNSSSNGSFVEATQDLQDKTSSSACLTPDRVMNDMAFLKESWANMVENDDDDEEARLSNDLVKEPTQLAENYQLKLSKGQKKTQKRLNQSSKDSYATRSKVLQKPFK